jgi:hypothetical protein
LRTANFGSGRLLPGTHQARKKPGWFECGGFTSPASLRYEQQTVHRLEFQLAFRGFRVFRGLKT